MNAILHKGANKRNVNQGWLYSKYAMSFVNYHNPAKIHFVVLGELNDDKISKNLECSSHPNMKNIFTPLEREFKHKHNTDNESIIKSVNRRVTGTGTDIMYFQYNNKVFNQMVRSSQIVVFSNNNNETFRYEQITLDITDREYKLKQIESPNPNDAGVLLHQDGWFKMINLENGKELNSLNDSER